MPVPTPAKEVEVRSPIRKEPAQKVHEVVEKTKPVAEEQKTTSAPTWTADEDAILRTGDDGALEALELRMGRGSVKRRMAELIASGIDL